MNYTEGHCKEKQKPGGCKLHNLQCGYPACDRKEIQCAAEAHGETAASPSPEGGALVQALERELIRRKVTSLPHKAELMGRLGLESLDAVHTWMRQTSDMFEMAAQDYIAAHSSQSPADGDGDLLEAVEAYLEAQGALDNREMMGQNAEPYEKLQPRCHRARERLESVISACRASKPQPKHTSIPNGWTIRDRSDLEHGAIDIQRPGAGRVVLTLSVDGGSMLYALALAMLHEAQDQAPASAPEAPADLTDKQKGDRWRELLPHSGTWSSEDWFEAASSSQSACTRSREIQARRQT